MEYYGAHEGHEETVQMNRKMTKVCKKREKTCGNLNKNVTKNVMGCSKGLTSFHFSNLFSYFLINLDRCANSNSGHTEGRKSGA